MKPKFRIPPVLGFLPLAFSLGITVLQTIVYLVSYDPKANYFLNDTIIPSTVTILLSLGLLLALSYVLLLPKGALSAQRLPLPKASLASAAGAVAAIVTLLIARPESNLFFAMLITLALTAAYHAWLPFARGEKQKNNLALLGFFAVISYALLTAYYYFDLTFEMNAPLKVFLQMGLLFSVVLTTEELRFLIGNARPRAYLMLSLSTATVGALTALPVPVAFVCGILDRTDYLAGALLVLGTSVAAAARASAMILQATKKSRLEKEKTNVN